MRGFTLIEMLVSVAIFTVVMTVALGALLVMSEADRQAETIQSAVNNLSFALDDMSRSIRTGSTYHCGSSGSLSSPQDCASTGASSFAYLSSTGQEVVYELGTTACQNGIGCILRSTDGGLTYLPLTSPDVVVTRLMFYVIGSSPTDTVQPKVTLLSSSYVTTSGAQSSVFNLESSVTQRLYDQ